MFVEPTGVGACTYAVTRWRIIAIMSKKAALPWNASLPPRQRPAAELLWTLRKGEDEIACVLRDLGDEGVGVKFLRNGEFLAGHRFETHAPAVEWAEFARHARVMMGYAPLPARTVTSGTSIRPTLRRAPRPEAPPPPPVYAIRESAMEMPSPLSNNVVRTRVLNRARVKRWQNARVAEGCCRECGNRRPSKSRSRCLACLERRRLAARRRRGILSPNRRPHGRPLLGDFVERRRDFREEEARRERRRASHAARWKRSYLW